MELPLEGVVSCTQKMTRVAEGKKHSSRLGRIHFTLNSLSRIIRQFFLYHSLLSVYLSASGMLNGNPRAQRKP